MPRGRYRVTTPAATRRAARQLVELGALDPGVVEHYDAHGSCPTDPPRPSGIKRLRARLGLTRMAFAAIFGINEGNVWTWEMEGARPSPDECWLLGLAIDRLPASVD